MEIIGQSYWLVVWDGQGFYRRDVAGKRMWIFRDRSPYPADAGAVVYGLAENVDECGFDGSGAPWCSSSCFDAFEFANGHD